MIRTRTFLGCVVLVFVLTFLVADGLRFDPVKDEVHFRSSAEAFRGAFPLEALRSYPEVVTPLALVIWGELDYVTGAGLFAGRLLNLALSCAIVFLVALCAPKAWPRGALAAVGLLLFPYSLPLAVHLYTDAPGTFFVVGGTIALARSRPALAWCAFSCAIATRQYLIQIPAALAAAGGLAWLRGDRAHWKAVLACGASCLTLLAWIAFFGDLAPKAGIDLWVSRYPAPMMSATDLILHHGLYFLTGVGAYFVLVEALLFRRSPLTKPMLGWRSLLLALALAGLFWLDPPVLSSSHQGGPLGRVARALLPAPDFDWARVAIYYGLALLGVLRFAGRLDAGFWVVAAGVVLATKQQLPWEKYLFPTLAVLWTQVSLGQLSGYGESDARTDDNENGFAKQSLPSAGFKT